MKELPMRLSVTLASIGGFLLLSSSGTRATPAADKPRQPVVVELFTSEGCSSCPPADALLQKLDRDQPVKGAFAIVLSEHVDYWDHLGWRDPFSSADFSRRQEGYGRRFHLNSVYTPQVVIDGSTEALGSDARQVQDAILQSVNADKLQIDISPVFKNSQGRPTVHVAVKPSGNSADREPDRRKAQLKAALAENTVISHVLRGENSGRKLDHVAVVRSLVNLGSLDASGAFNADIPLTGELAQWIGKRFIVFVQNPQYGRIQGAALQLLSPS
jgi:hypothetical protein